MDEAQRTAYKQSLAEYWDLFQDALVFGGKKMTGNPHDAITYRSEPFGGEAYRIFTKMRMEPGIQEGGPPLPHPEYYRARKGFETKALRKRIDDYREMLGLPKSQIMYPPPEIAPVHGPPAPTTIEPFSWMKQPREQEQFNPSGRVPNELTEAHEKDLKEHGIESKRVGGRLYARDSYTDRSGKPHHEWVDVSGWSKQELRQWLGYD